MEIGEFARQLGLSAPTVRYYESLGLLAEAGRVSGRRRYGPDAINRLRGVLALKRAGFSLSEIKSLLSLDARERTRERWVEVAESKVAELDRAILELELARSALASSLDCECEGRADLCKLVENTSGIENREPRRRRTRASRRV
jgi:MerR family mercuric resistance operon transcriptional regulator